MTDKDVERNVRSTVAEGVATPYEKHVHGIGEQHTISFGEKFEARKSKNRLLDKFRKREKERKSGKGKS